MDFLLLRLEAPLQAWGLRGMWDIRDCGTEPSKSGIIGLLASCLGLERRDHRILDLDRQVTIGIRVEREGTLLNDYHTVTNSHLLQADGGTFDGTIETHRYYLQDASFLVVVAGPGEVIRQCRESLANPTWVPYLGRKCCVPTRPLVEGCDTRFGSIEEILKNYPWAGWGMPPKVLRCIVDDPAGGEEERRDQIGTKRPYMPRSVREFTVAVPAGVP